MRNEQRPLPRAFRLARDGLEKSWSWGSRGSGLKCVGAIVECLQKGLQMKGREREESGLKEK